MGIEPTRHSFEPLNGFEDRGGHQTSKRFRALILLAQLDLTFRLVERLYNLLYN